MAKNGFIAVDPQVKSELLINYFYSVFHINNSIIPPSFSPAAMPELHIYINFFTTALFQLLSQLDPKSAEGQMDFPFLFSNTACSIAASLAHLFSISYANSPLSPSWLTASITSIFMIGDPSNNANYRLISLTSSVCKVMEWIIKDGLCKTILVVAEFHLINMTLSQHILQPPIFSNRLTTGQFS